MGRRPGAAGAVCRPGTRPVRASPQRDRWHPKSLPQQPFLGAWETHQGGYSAEGSSGRRGCGAQREVGGVSSISRRSPPEDLDRPVGAGSRLTAACPPQASSSPNMDAGEDAITTRCRDTCVTTGSDPSPSAGAATSTRAPSLCECSGTLGAWPCTASWGQPVARSPRERAAHAAGSAPLCLAMHSGLSESLTSPQ